MSAQLAQAPRSTLWIDYDNDTGPGDEGLLEWWSVIDESTGDALCKCDDEATAKRILAALAAFEAAPQQEPVAWVDERAIAWLEGRSKSASITTPLQAHKSAERPMPLYAAPQQAQAPAMSRPFDAVKSFTDSVLSMLDERIKTSAQASHPFNDKFGDHPETLVAAKAQESELKEVRHQVRLLGDRALVELMKFKRPQEAQQAQAPGWQLVPVYPTTEMLDAGRWSEYGEDSSRLRAVDDDEVAGVWALMLKAAPKKGE